MKSRTILHVSLLALAALALTAPGATAAGMVRSCGTIVFTPNSDDAATHIRATGLTCGLARDFVRDAKGRPGKRFRGFRCTGVDVDRPGALSYTRFRCTGAGDVIRWRRY